MTERVAAVLVGQSDDVSDVVEAVRWIIPWLEAAATDELWFAALVLAEGLPADVSAIWLWWIGSRRPDLIEIDNFDDGAGLKDDFRSVLRWTVQRGVAGIAEYDRLEAEAGPYLQALRELARATREFSGLQSCIDALRSGKPDLSFIMGQMPGSYGAPALKGGRMGLVMEAQTLRDEAVKSGVPPDFPSVAVMPRFARTPEPSRQLALDLLGGLPGFAEGRLHGDCRPLLLPATLTLEEGFAAGQVLRERGLPVEEKALGPVAWLSHFSASGAIPDGAGGEGPDRLRSLLKAVQRGWLPQNWWEGAVLSTFWEGEESALLLAAYEYLLHAGCSALAADLLEAAEVTLPRLVGELLAAALDRSDAPESAMITVTRAMQALDDLLASVEGHLTW